MSNHPVIKMNHVRAKVWKDEASDEDFLLYLRDLAAIYAARKREKEYKESGQHNPPDELALFKDYKAWLVNNG